MTAPFSGQKNCTVRLDITGGLIRRMGPCRRARFQSLAPRSAGPARPCGSADCHCLCRPPSCRDGPYRTNHAAGNDGSRSRTHALPRRATYASEWRAEFASSRSLTSASACVKFTSMCASACTGARTAFALDPDRRELAPTGRQTRISLTPCLIKERCAPIGHVCPLSVVWVSRLFGRLPGPTAGCR